MRTIIPFTLLPALACFLLGCASNQSTAYTPQAAEQRDPQKAQRLTLEAAELMATKPTRAEALLREALAADIFHGPAHNNLGVLYLTMSPPKLYEAASEFEWARKLMPGHPDPRMNLALVLEKAGRADEALITYAAALEVYPNYIPAIQALVRLQVRSGTEGNHTPEHLREVALRGETELWRQWARTQLLERDPNGAR